MQKKKRLLFILVFFISGLAIARAQTLHLIYIGDSITAGAGLQDAGTQAPPVIASAYLQQDSKYQVDFSNQGHSGFTTVDFLPGGDTFAAAEQAASAFNTKSGTLVFSIMLGTNDSAITGPNGAPVSAAGYYDNLKIIVDQLLKDYPDSKIIIQQPLWYSPNTYNGAKYLQEGLNRLKSYFPQIKKLVKSYSRGQVFLGDTKGFNYYKNNYKSSLQPENGRQGIFYLHPNKAGAETLGVFWAKAIGKCLDAR